MIQGEIYYGDLSPVVGDEIGGIRPVVIVKHHGTTATVVPLYYDSRSSESEPYSLSRHIRTIDVRRLTHERLGQISPKGMKELKSIVISLV